MSPLPTGAGAKPLPLLRATYLPTHLQQAFRGWHVAGTPYSPVPSSGEGGGIIPRISLELTFQVPRTHCIIHMGN